MADSVELPDSIAEPSDSDAEPEFASEMEIIVQPYNVRNVVLLVDGDNIVEDVLVEILGRDRAGREPEPRLFFNDTELQKQKTLADCGIKLGSVLHLKCTPRVLVHTDDPKRKAKLDSAESSSPMRPNGDGEMKIFVQLKYHGCYALEVDSSNTIRDVLVTVLAIWEVKSRPEPGLSLNGHLLETAKSLADYGIQDGSILNLEVPMITLCGGIKIERPNVISGRKRITITDRPLAIWEKEHDKVLLSLLVEQISNGERKNILYGGEDFWCNIVAKFNESTGLKYEYKHLSEHFNLYRREYYTVKRIRHHPKFSWDHHRQVVIATDAEWNEYIKGNRNAMPYRRRAIPYFDLLGILFDGTN